MLQSSSVEAVINARLVALRAPIEGSIEAKAMPSAGSAVAAYQILSPSGNERAERGASTRCARRSADCRTERRRRRPTRRRRAAIEAVAAQLGNSSAAAPPGWKRNSPPSTSTSPSRRCAATRRQKLTRGLALAHGNAISDVALGDTQRAARIADETLAAAKLRREQAAIELRAMAAGSYLGDSYNDRPQSAQKLEAVETLAADLEAELHTRDLRLARLTKELAAVTQRFELEAAVAIAAPVEARIWELLAFPGEQVMRGQDLVRLLDCSGAVVTAAVSEDVYNTLHSGMPARFTARGGGGELEGVIVNLTGLAGASSNYAIEPSALTKEPYRVTVAVPGVAGGAGCDIGRTGRVLFGAVEDQPLLVRLLRFLTGFAA
jgi:multidrug resistance efflux pump